MNTKPPFDGGPASEMSARADMVKDIAGHGAFVTNLDGNWRFSASAIASRSIEVADACLDALDKGTRRVQT